MTPRERRLALFNLTPADYDRILEHQGGVCAICRRPPKPGKRLAVEHRHRDGLVRGLVCWACNQLIAALEAVCPHRMAEVTAYLAGYGPATEALGALRYGLPGRSNTKKQRRLYRKLKRQQDSESERGE